MWFLRHDNWWSRDNLILLRSDYRRWWSLSVKRNIRQFDYNYSLLYIYSYFCYILASFLMLLCCILDVYLWFLFVCTESLALVSDPTSRRFIGWLLFQTFIYIYIYIIYVWKLNQTVLELDFELSMFCSSLDGIWSHTIDTLQHQSLYIYVIKENTWWKYQLSYPLHRFYIPILVSHYLI